MFLSGGLSELDSTLYLNAMNQSPNPWHVSFSYARALQNTVLKTWAGDDAKKAEAQAILARRAKENGLAQLGKFVAGDVSESESESTYQKNYGEGYQRCDNFDHSIFKPIPHHLTTVP
tara:strand:+ start:338 stop:691 length:354 start_codon:yes stop_codon:yes gene_type:complete